MPPLVWIKQDAIERGKITGVGGKARVYPGLVVYYRVYVWNRLTDKSHYKSMNHTLTGHRLYKSEQLQTVKTATRR